jgi:hypothetical protein
MSETTDPIADSPLPPVARPPAVAPPAPPAAPPPAAGGGRQDTIADVRAEAASYRIALREARQELADAKSAAEAALAQLEAAKSGAATAASKPLEAKLQRAMDRVMSTSLQTAMVAAGLQDPDLIALFDRMPDRPDVKVDDDFNVVGVDKLVEAAKKWKPDYFKAPADPGKTPPKKAAPEKTGEGNDPPASGGAGVVDIKSMDRKAYNTWKNAQLNAMRAPGAAGWGR